MRLLCVVPRYGENVLGGAETLVRGFAATTQAMGVETHILTTCATDYITWRNVLPAGFSRQAGVPVWRYPLQDWHANEQNQRLHYQITTHQPISLEEQYAWLDNGPHSPALYAHLERYGPRYDAIILAPYPFPLIQYAAAVYPQKSIIWPCLHNEAFASFESTRLMLQGALGILYNSEPERELARLKLGIDHPNSIVAGIGINDYSSNAKRFRQHYHLQAPFILYAGRVESIKNVRLLAGYFIAYKRERGGPLQLVLIGDGQAEIPRHPDILQLGFVKANQLKLDAYAAATLLCQPSTLESFSIVIMEAWLAGVPALVHSDCPVTRLHCQRSGGGLYFADEEEFIGCVDWFLANPGPRAQMGQQGRAYVLAHYTWEAVARRTLEALQGWLK